MLPGENRNYNHHQERIGERKWDGQWTKGRARENTKIICKNYKGNLRVPLTLRNFINCKQSTEYFEVLTQVQGVSDLQTHALMNKTSRTCTFYKNQDLGPSGAYRQTWQTTVLLFNSWLLWLDSLTEETDPVTTRFNNTSEIPCHGLSCYTETYKAKEKVAVQATLEKFNFSWLTNGGHEHKPL